MPEPRVSKFTVDPQWATKAPCRVAFGNADMTNRCPIWGDKLRFKSITVVVDAADEQDAIASCTYVHGSDCIRKIKRLPDGKVALRSDYMCW